MRRLVVALFVALLVVALVASMIGTASAHGELGEIAAQITADPDHPTEVVIRARIVYMDDGHPVEDDAVVGYAVTGDPEDVVHAEGAMPRVGDGQYEVAVSLPVPGAYRVTVDSLNPEAQFETVHVVEAAPASSDDEVAEEPADGDDGDVTISWPVVIGIVVFLALVVGVVLTAARRRRA